MHALVCLDTQGLNRPVDQDIHAGRPRRKDPGPVVRQREDVAHVMAVMAGTPPWVAPRLSGSGRRIMEAWRLRVQDSDVAMQAVTVRAGQGDHERVTTVSTAMMPLLNNHVIKVNALHEADVAQGYGAVSLPQALARTDPGAGRAWGWPDVFPARHLSEDPRPGGVRRPQVDASVVNNALGIASRQVGLATRVRAQTCRHRVATHVLPRGTEIRTVQARLGHQDVSTTMMDTPVWPQGGDGMASPRDDLERSTQMHVAP